jgi:hypothetical protein
LYTAAMVEIVQKVAVVSQVRKIMFMKDANLNAGQVFAVEEIEEWMLHQLLLFFIHMCSKCLQNEAQNKNLPVTTI